jgi:hypothetical protein
MSDPLTLKELQELEKLLLILQFAQPDSPTPLVVLEPPARLETVKSQEKQSKPEPAAIEPVRDFIDRICGEGSNKPSGRALGKDSWMG